MSTNIAPVKKHATAGAWWSALSPTQKKCIETMRAQGGVITRHPGGFWCAGRTYNRGVSFGASTVQSLVAKKIIEYSAHQKHRLWEGRFPVEARLYPNQPPVDNAFVSPGCELFATPPNPLAQVAELR